MVFDDDTLLVVAEDETSGRILGTASVIFDLAAFGDLAVESRRLSVHPEGRRPDIGVVLYKNIAKSLVQKLRNLAAEVAQSSRGRGH